LSKKIFQNLIYQIKDIFDLEFGVIDKTGVIIACSNEAKQGEVDDLTPTVISDKNQIVILNGTTYQKIIIKGKIEYITFIEADDKYAAKYLSLVSINVLNLSILNDDKYDKSNFIRNIITDKISPEEIPFKAKELHINNNATRVVFIVTTDSPDEKFAREVLQNLFPIKTKDFILTPDSESVILIKEFKSGEDYNIIEQTAKSIVDTLMAESMVNAFVGIGRTCNNLAGLPVSYKEAKTALEVGNIFGNNRNVISYEKLGIGRLIYQLPEPLCKLFLEEIFDGCSKNFFDNEMVQTIQKFFENDLNVSEASRQLYVHRNTLVYRLDKIEKEIGLDIRKFDDAIILKFAILVKRYIEGKE
jgi:carbohydrate diacid regulator